MRKRTGGAFLWWFWVVVDHDFDKASPSTRQFILAHEWGHVVKGHLARLYGFWLIFLPADLLVWPHFQNTKLAMLGPLTVLLSLFLSTYFRTQHHEFEADRFAASVVGEGKGPNSFTEAVAWSGQKWQQRHSDRLAMLRRQEAVEEVRAT